MVERYPLRNSDDSEVTRLGLLQALGDPVTIRWFDDIGVADGWHCAELGAGAGSMVRWLADRVGPRGSVTAVDRDTAQLQELAKRANVAIVEGDLGALELPRRDYDLVHTRSVLMHLDDPETVVRAAVAALRPGGVAFFEETDGAPALASAADGAPTPFAKVMVPIAGRWTFARTMTDLLESLGMVEVEVDVRAMPLDGASDTGVFWQHTLRSVMDHTGPGGAHAGLLDHADIEAMIDMLDDPGFSVPFTDRHRVTARRPR